MLKSVSQALPLRCRLPRLHYSLLPLLWLIQSAIAITDVKNKVSVIARPPNFKLVRYSKVRLAGERLEKRPV